MASRSPAAPVHEWDGIFRSSFLRSLAMLCGGIVALLAVALLLALVTFSPADPSYTTAAGGALHNWLGRPGAWVASVLLLAFGWPALLIVPSMARMAWRLIVGPDRAGPQRRLMVGLVGMAITGIGLSVWENMSSRLLTAGWGGLVGLVAERPLDALLAPLSEGAALAVRAFLTLLLVSFGLWLWWRSLQLSGVRLALPRWPGRAAPDDDDRDRLIDMGYDDDGEDRAPVTTGPRRPVRPVDDASRPEIAEPAAAPSPAARRKAPQQTDMFADSSLPALSLLTPAPERSGPGIDKAALEKNARLLESVLDDFSVKGVVKAVRPGPVVTM